MTHILEIVRLRLVEGTSDTDFLAAAKGTEPVVAKAPGFCNRRLTKGEDGFWTDVIEWTSMENAKGATDTVMPTPELAPFGALIDGESVEMRHETIEMKLE